MKRMPNLNDWLGETVTTAPINIQGIANDSRKIKKNWCYIALPLTDGTHGMKYYHDAVANGAIAVVSDIAPPNNKVISIKLPKPFHSKSALAELYQRFFNTKILPFYVLGITGTNGKTSTSWITAQILLSKYERIGILGTLGNGLITKSSSCITSSCLTTLDNLALHAQLKEYVNEKADAVVMEVSSHGIEQQRIAGIDFDVSTLTNVTSDHLDYHNSLESYRQVKKKFFTEYKAKKIVINTDDEMGKLWAKELTHLCTYGSNSDAMLRASNIQTHYDGIRFDISYAGATSTIKTPLIGVFQVSNILAAVASAMAVGLSFEECLRMLTKLQPVPGRMQWIRNKNAADIVIDFAHTQDALKAVLISIRQHLKGKIWCVFGCGGDRDTTKRTLMGAVAQQYADYIIVTDDNPRTENAASIRKAILRDTHDAKEIANRAEAIKFAIENAQIEDTVLIAGKGHEEYQIYGTKKIVFSDLTTVLRIIQPKSLDT